MNLSLRASTPVEELVLTKMRPKSAVPTASTMSTMMWHGYKFISHLTPDEPPLWHLASPNHEFKHAAARIDDDNI
ncbi:hypothetical protein NC652_018443 [Populus alba x Populus x berolinensis]|nr:hypothetical protein NC652_018443 [Populus alba x Populus x berolinensis]